MKLSAAVRRCRKELPEAPGNAQWPPLLTTADQRQAKHHLVCPGASTVRGAIVGPSWTAWESRYGFRKSRYYGFELSRITPTYT